MNPQIVAALIPVLGGLLGFLGKKGWDAIGSKRYRKNNTIPNIVGTVWEATWLTDSGEPYVKDKIEFKKWTKRNQFVGSGDMTYDHEGRPTRYIYPIEGEVTPNRVVVFTYRAQNYPTESLIGSACMELDPTAKKLNGWWVGRRRIASGAGEYEWRLLPGRVEMSKIS